MVRTRMWRNGTVAAEDFPVEDVSDHLERPDEVVWVDFTDPTADELARIEDELGIHALASEDALEPGQRPKLDRYHGALFLVAYDVTCSRGGTDLVTHEVKAFVTERAVVTMHAPGFDAQEFVRRWDANDDLAGHGAAFLVWGVLDVLADHATATVEQLEDLIDHLEDDLFEVSAQTSHIQRRSFALRKALGTLRRLVGPQREVIQTLVRGDATQVSDGLRPYYRDVADHITSATEQVDQLRESVSSVLETNLNLASNRMNLVMKKVTSWAAIIAIPTAITGWFGQNIKFPGEGAWSGLVASAVLIVVSSVALYTVFRRRDWL
ncbi:MULTISPECIES: magnesium transporter CorA family protein [unclassified Curtobacterium]|uniref:magnesium transporter CorA family protein n=1 Tax=unclassified Curtobacterium TaxID=257496 RepID=UPI001C651603|nr:MULTISPECIES: magnesium transporter CorA family protein [unclassified Curtobacterium]